MFEEVTAIRQLCQSIVVGKMLQLLCALGHPFFEFCLLFLYATFGFRQLTGHFIEGSRQLVEFAHAAARHRRNIVARSKASCRLNQASYRQGHTARRQERNDENEPESAD